MDGAQKQWIQQLIAQQKERGARESAMMNSMAPYLQERANQAANAPRNVFWSKGVFEPTLREPTKVDIPDFQWEGALEPTVTPSSDPRDQWKDRVNPPGPGEMPDWEPGAPDVDLSGPDVDGPGWDYPDPDVDVDGNWNTPSADPRLQWGDASASLPTPSADPRLQWGDVSAKLPTPSADPRLQWGDVGARLPTPSADPTLQWGDASASLPTPSADPTLQWGGVSADAPGIQTPHPEGTVDFPTGKVPPVGIQTPHPEGTVDFPTGTVPPIGIPTADPTAIWGDLSAKIPPIHTPHPEGTVDFPTGDVSLPDAEMPDVNAPGFGEIDPEWSMDPTMDVGNPLSNPFQYGRDVDLGFAAPGIGSIPDIFPDLGGGGAINYLRDKAKAIPTPGIGALDPFWEAIKQGAGGVGDVLNLTDDAMSREDLIRQISGDESPTGVQSANDFLSGLYGGVFEGEPTGPEGGGWQEVPPEGKTDLLGPIGNYPGGGESGMPRSTLWNILKDPAGFAGAVADAGDEVWGSASPYIMGLFGTHKEGTAEDPPDMRLPGQSSLGDRFSSAEQADKEQKAERAEARTKWEAELADRYDTLQGEMTNRMRGRHPMYIEQQTSLAFLNSLEKDGLIDPEYAAERRQELMALDLPKARTSPISGGGQAAAAGQGEAKSNRRQEASNYASQFIPPPPPPLTPVEEEFERLYGPREVTPPDMAPERTEAVKGGGQGAAQKRFYDRVLARVKKRHPDWTDFQLAVKAGDIVAKNRSQDFLGNTDIATPGLRKTGR